MADYTFFSKAHGRFSRLDHLLGHKISINKSKRIKSFQVSFQPQGTKLKENGKTHKYMEIKQHTPEKPMGQRRIFLKNLETNKMETQNTKT